MVVRGLASSMVLLCTSSLHRVVVPMDEGFLVLSQSSLTAAVVLFVVVAFLLSSFVVCIVLLVV